MLAMRNDVGLVLDDPFHDFPFLELHGFRDGCREVDVVLISSFLPFDELNLCRIPHVFSPVLLL